MFTRREILASFLGLPFAVSACQFSSADEKILPEGEIVGASADVGHLLRNFQNAQISENSWENKKIAIVGGGIAGLSAAWKLKKLGFEDFVLLELEPEIGGTSRSGRMKNFSYPWAAHYLPVPFKENRELISLVNEMDLTEGVNSEGEILVKEEFLCREPEERIFYKGRWYEGLYLNVGASVEDKRQLTEFQKEVDFWVNWRDAKGKRAFTLPVADCSTDVEATDLDKISFADWLTKKGFDSPRLLHYCDYACRDDYGLRVQQTSAWAGLFYFCSRVRKSGEESQPFITFPEGNGRFVSHFYGQVKEKVRLQTLVKEIIPQEKGVDIICLNPANNQLFGIHAEKVIFASPIFTTNYLIRDFREKPQSFAKEFEHNAWFVANLLLKDRPKSKLRRDFPLSWDNVIYESNSLGYVASTHQSGIDYGETVFTYYFPMCEKDGHRKLLSTDWKELADICLTDLELCHKDIRGLTSRIEIMRWGHAMISPRPNFLWSGVREQAQKPYRNIYFAHSDLSGLALFEEAFYHGLRAVEEVLRR